MVCYFPLIRAFATFKEETLSSPNGEQVPFLQKSSAAAVAAKVLETNLGSSVRDFIFIDFCAGGGGPTPFVERFLNQALADSAAPDTQSPPRGRSTGARARKGEKSLEPVQFILTDLHPHVENWRQAAAQSPNIQYRAGVGRRRTRAAQLDRTGAGRREEGFPAVQPGVPPL